MIVSDATAIITLININEFDLLKLFTKKIILTKNVFDEVTVYEQAKKYLECEKNFIEIVEHDDERLFNEFCLLLDAGEASSIILTMQKKLPLIIDEKKVGESLLLRKLILGILAQVRGKSLTGLIKICDALIRPASTYKNPRGVFI